ncbi:hypothetical protein [Nonlabens dokdonensis]|uniref:hypothetical protein n=1 Tax=Nonlabens dokdonensis TaxID=328515 RepID=UPI0026E97FBC|nr:hypothetical protein [Nonlabens dokdonensis]
MSELKTVIHRCKNHEEILKAVKAIKILLDLGIGHNATELCQCAEKHQRKLDKQSK